MRKRIIRRRKCIIKKQEKYRIIYKQMNSRRILCGKSAKNVLQQAKNSQTKIREKQNQDLHVFTSSTTRRPTSLIKNIVKLHKLNCDNKNRKTGSQLSSSNTLNQLGLTKNEIQKELRLKFLKNFNETPQEIEENLQSHQLSSSSSRRYPLILHKPQLITNLTSESSSSSSGERTGERITPISFNNSITITPSITTQTTSSINVNDILMGTTILTRSNQEETPKNLQSSRSSFLSTTIVNNNNNDNKTQQPTTLSNRENIKNVATTILSFLHDQNLKRKESFNNSSTTTTTTSSAVVDLKKPIKRLHLKVSSNKFETNIKAIIELKKLLNTDIDGGLQTKTNNSFENNLKIIATLKKVLSTANNVLSNESVLLDGRYFFFKKIEGTPFFYCIDIKTKQRLMCKISNESCTKLIEAHARLKGHPFINQIQAIFRKEDKTYTFFPMWQNDLLSYVRKTRAMNESEARHLFGQMCIIVKSCHEQGIILRDLKLRKFVFADINKKHLILESLVDAVILDDPNNDLLEEKRGCPVYVAPEILKSNQTYYGKAADMWSLGVILYTMLVGRYPFNDTEHSGLFAKISRGQFLIPETVSPKANCLIRSLLRQEPEERMTSEDVLYHPWMTKNKDNDYKLLPSDQCVPEYNF